MRLWLDDVRPAPEGYIWCFSVNGAIAWIKNSEYEKYAYGGKGVELLDLDHDLGDYAADGGDGVKLLDWLEETGRNYPIRIHSANVVGVQNMRRIIERNGWKEVK